MWRALFSAKFSDVEFYPPTSNAAIGGAEASVGLRFPAELKSLYSETNSVYFTDAYMWLIWPLHQLVKENQYMHTSPEIAFYNNSFTDLLFFGELGNGDLPAVHIDLSSQAPLSVGVWDHEDGKYYKRADTLREYFG